VGTKRDEFEESTKIKSSAEISEMLRNAGVATDDDDDGSDDFESDVHTQVGNIAELIAKSKEMGDLPVVARSSTNIIRRTQTPIAIERVAIGSQSDIPSKTDDEAFEEMLGAPAAVETKQAKDDLEVEIDGDVPRESRIALPLPAPPRSMELPVIRPLPVVAEPKKWRWGAIAWVVLLIATIGLGTMSYMKIAQLEDELAVAREQLKK
jgi:hypothetical protein